MASLAQSELRGLIGAGVVRFERDSEGGGILFANGANLAIYNDFKIKSEAYGDDASIVGAHLLDVKKTKDVICFEFDNGVCWLVDISGLLDFGPEVFQLRFPDGRIIIWRQEDN